VLMQFLKNFVVHQKNTMLWRYPMKFENASRQFRPLIFANKCKKYNLKVEQTKHITRDNTWRQHATTRHWRKASHVLTFEKSEKITTKYKETLRCSTCETWSPLIPKEKRKTSNTMIC
jgi:ferredoxin-like protein FixX